MGTATLVPQQEQTTEETAPALRPWSTPRLQRLNHAAETTHKTLFVVESSVHTSYQVGPSVS